MRSLCLLMALLVPGLLDAQQIQPPRAGVSQWEVGVLGGYRWSGELAGFEDQFGGRRFAIDLDDGPMLGLAIAAPIGGVHQIELWASRQSADLEPAVSLQTEMGKMDVTYLHLSVLRHWYGGVDTATYVGIGAGATMFDLDAPDTQSATHPSASLFLGGKYFLKSNLLLRADVRGYWTFGDDELSERVGIIRFGYPDDMLQVEASVGVSMVF